MSHGTGPILILDKLVDLVTPGRVAGFRCLLVKTYRSAQRTLVAMSIGNAKESVGPAFSVTKFGTDLQGLGVEPDGLVVLALTSMHTSETAKSVGTTFSVGQAGIDLI